MSMFSKLLFDLLQGVRYAVRLLQQLFSAAQQRVHLCGLRSAAASPPQAPAPIYEVQVPTGTAMTRALSLKACQNRSCTS